MSQRFPGTDSTCRKGDYQYKDTIVNLPDAFSFDKLISSQPPESQAVLDAVSLICHDCGQRKDAADSHCIAQAFCNDCFEEKFQAPANWVAILHQH